MALRPRWWTELIQDARLAVRGMGRSPGFTAVAVLILALGIGGTTAVFSAVDAVLLEPLPYDHPGQLVRLYQHYLPAGSRTYVTPVHFLAYRERLASFEAVAAIYNYSETGMDIGGSDRPRRIRSLGTSADYLEVTRVRPVLGRGFERRDEGGPPVVLLSDDIWRRELGADPSAIGRSFRLSGRPYEIIGVMPPDFVDPVVGRVDVWLPRDLAEGRDPTQAGNHYLTVIGRLRPGTTFEQAESEVANLDRAMEAENPAAKYIRAILTPLKEDLVAPASRSLEVMLGAVGLVLALVCANLANLLLVRGSARARELALRTALGAPRSRLIRQLLIESLILAVAGAAAGLVVARLAMPAIVALGQGAVPRLGALSLEPELLGFAMLLAALSAVGFGLLPALRATEIRPTDALRDQPRAATATGRQGRLRSWLVASQVALAFVLLVGVGLLTASFARLRAVDLGIKPGGVLTFSLSLPEARYDSLGRARFFERFAERVERIPGVRAAGGISKLPATGEYNEWDATAQSGPLAGTRAAGTMAQQRIVSGDYFRAVGIPVLKGRAFGPADSINGPPRVVVSRELARRLFPGVDPIGQRLRAGNRTSEVVGVVADVAITAEGGLQPFVYHPHAQFAGDRNWSLDQVVAGSDQRLVATLLVRRALAELDPELVLFRPMALADAIGRGTATRLFTLRLLSAFAAVALALAGLGLFGVLSYSVRLRTRELGIRMALGADRRRIRVSVLRSALGVTAGGLAVGLAGALALSRLIGSLLFQVSALDPMVLVAALVFMLGVSAIAAAVPATRATRVDPRAALQGD